MEYNTSVKSNLLVLLFMLSGGLFMACDNDIKVGNTDKSIYETSKEISGYVINAEGKRTTATVEFRNTGKAQLYLALTKEVSQPVSATFKYNKAVWDEYNKANETDYQLFPENLVTFQNNGEINLASGENRSNSVSVSFSTGESLNPNTSYIIPISVEIKSGGIVTGQATDYLIFVKDLTQLPDASKSTGIQIISCMEVNDTNPLNNLCFTLKESGKPLIDMVILFSGNINYDSETGRVYNLNNPNVQHLLSNREKYLKPLQDRGMKVILGILGNHDRAGIANLSKETAQAFAKELKSVCDTYQLDGFFFDDEYSKPIAPPPTGFVEESNDAAARLLYEAKKAMPDKLMCVFVYGCLYSFINPVDGVYAGNFVDWAIPNYGVNYDLSEDFPGLSKSGMAICSQEFAGNYFVSENSLKALRKNGYGGNMIFAMDPFRDNFANGQLSAMKRMATTLFDEELVYDGNRYKKDW